MNKLSNEDRAKVIACLVEGCSMRSTVRMTGAAKKTVSRLLVEIGMACADYQDKAMVNLPCRKLQVDEIWAFCYCKEKNAPEHLKGKRGIGDVWTWVAICADTKLIPAWFTGDRSAGSAYHFMHNLAKRLKDRVQLTSDGHRAYLSAVESAFGCNIDYAQLIKLYGQGQSEGEVRYSPAECIGTRRGVVSGNPNPRHISTSFAERQNLTMRMQMRRFTRLTNAFSKKFENHCHAIALYAMHYNFCRIHQTLRVTPAMEAGVADHVWSLEEIAALLD
jgi:IS1 family transposase